MARKKRNAVTPVGLLYPSLYPYQATHPIEEHINNSDEMHMAQSRLNKAHSSVRIKDDQPSGAGTFEPSGNPMSFGMEGHEGVG